MRRADPGAPVSVRGAFATMLATLRNIAGYRDMALFFIARMLFIDGLLAIFTFGGVYAAAVFGWQTLVVGYFGIILSVAAGVGALVGGVSRRPSRLEAGDHRVAAAADRRLRWA